MGADWWPAWLEINDSASSQTYSRKKLTSKRADILDQAMVLTQVFILDFILAPVSSLRPYPSYDQSLVDLIGVCIHAILGTTHGHNWSSVLVGYSRHSINHEPLSINHYLVKHSLFRNCPLFSLNHTPVLYTEANWVKISKFQTQNQVTFQFVFRSSPGSQRTNRPLFNH